MRVLVDMDGVIANFELGFLEQFKNLYPHIKDYIPLEERTTFHIKEQYSTELKSKVDSVIFSKGFFKSLPPITGSIEALRKIEEKGHEVFICTSPLRSYKNCVLEKYEWVDYHLGRDFVNRIILSRDKTMITGDLLIDDRPEIKGSNKPSWEHIIFSQPYNQKVEDKRRIQWEYWERIIG